MVTGNTIDRFAGEYSFLSNFYPVEIVFGGESYPSVEHAYQAAKTLNLEERAWIRAAKKPGTAKKLGKTVTLRPGWNELRLRVMEELVLQKFSRDNALRAELVATGDLQIVEGNTWKDAFWGVYDGKGENHLGRILMSVRSRLCGACAD